jgi:hypothetical protein
LFNQRALQKQNAIVEGVSLPKVGADVSNRLAHLLLSTKNTEKATASFHDALAYSPNNSKVRHLYKWVNVGDVGIGANGHATK